MARRSRAATSPRMNESLILFRLLRLVETPERLASTEPRSDRRIQTTDTNIRQPSRKGRRAWDRQRVAARKIAF
jgi:hypothetical protein